MSIFILDMSGRATGARRRQLPAFGSILSSWSILSSFSTTATWPSSTSPRSSRWEIDFNIYRLRPESVFRIRMGPYSKAFWNWIRIRNTDPLSSWPNFFPKFMMKTVSGSQVANCRGRSRSRWIFFILVNLVTEGMWVEKKERMFFFYLINRLMNRCSSIQEILLVYLALIQCCCAGQCSGFRVFWIRIEIFGWIRIQLNTDPNHWLNNFKSVWLRAFESSDPKSGSWFTLGSWYKLKNKFRKRPSLVSKAWMAVKS